MCNQTYLYFNKWRDKMNNMKITLSIQDLKDAGACANGIECFKKLFGSRRTIVWNPLNELLVRKDPKLKNFFQWLLNKQLMPSFSFSYMQLNSADLRYADLYNADFCSADLRYADLYNANLTDANLMSADFRNADLRDANLYNTDLRNAKLSAADLRNANLNYANLRYAKLIAADLRSANLIAADLRSANLHNAVLRFVNLSNADLRNANLSNADLYNVDLSNARYNKYTIFPENLKIPETMFLVK